MNEAFEKYLQSNDVDEDSLLEGLRTYLLEQTDYLAPEEMRAEMTEKSANANKMEQLLEQLANDSASLVGMAHIILGLAWYNPQQRELVIEAINSAKKKLPIIEIGIIAIIGMYGMYLIATGGVRDQTKTTAQAAQS